RIVPAGPSVPRVSSLSDGVKLLAEKRITSGVLKITMLENAHPEEFRVAVDGEAGIISDTFCVDPGAQRYEFNVDLPRDLRPGRHEVHVAVGKRPFPPMAIEVVPD